MNHLMRDLAPVTADAWSQIDDEATRSLKHYLAARRLIDLKGPHGWGYSSVDLGRVIPLQSEGALAGADVALRKVLPLFELRVPFTLDRAELAAAERGADNIDLDPVIDAARTASLTEDGVIFHGHEAAGIEGIATASPHAPIAITDDYSEYPEHVARAVAELRAADISGPYGIALGPRCYTGVTETTEEGGYPVFEHLRKILGGPVVWAPAVDGAVVLSLRGGDHTITVGQDFSIGYLAHDAATVQLYLEESLTFQINEPKAAIHLAYR